MELPRPLQGHTALHSSAPCSVPLPSQLWAARALTNPLLCLSPFTRTPSSSYGAKCHAPPHVVLSSPHMWVRGSKHSSSTPGSAYTCLEAATGRALLRQHMDTTGEEHPLNKLRVVIEPGLGGWAAGIRAALWWGAAWHRGGSDESEHSARFAEQGMISFVPFPFCPARCQPGRHVQ